MMHEYLIDCEVQSRRRYKVWAPSEQAALKRLHESPEAHSQVEAKDEVVFAEVIEKLQPAGQQIE